MSEQQRALFGAGMGVDFLAESGTLHYLEGTDYKGVRSPHDYFIGSFARLGFIGLGLIVAIIAQLARRMIRFRRRIAEDELLTFAALLVIAMIPVAKSRRRSGGTVRRRSVLVGSRADSGLGTRP